jgi:metal-responsive CopG/Arc/MetJ family transcriptional regulator
MQKRTTIALNQDYLKSLKVIAAKREKSLSALVNEAVRNYLSKLRKKENNAAFYKQLDEVKENIVMDKDNLEEYIKKGRL